MRIHKYQNELKTLLALLIVLGFYGVYHKVSLVHNVVDVVVEPAAAGITLAYGKMSTFFFKYTGINLGFVSRSTDPEFEFRVRIANYVKSKNAGALVKLSIDHGLPRIKREMAMDALLRFDSTKDWVQPFLNEIYKGGMLGLYEEKPTLLDRLIKQIRVEGGIRQTLVRAYAEVVFSFMMQNPENIIRKRALRWVSDVLAEDAVFLVSPRVDRELEADVRKEVEDALWNIRAISDRNRAKTLLIPKYRNPPWPKVRIPLAVVLARLGYWSARHYLKPYAASKKLTSEQRVMVRVALAGTPYPKNLRMTKRAEILVNKKRRARKKQYRLALANQRRIQREEQLKKILIARAEARRQAEQRAKEKARLRRLALAKKRKEAKKIEVAALPKEKEVIVKPAPTPKPTPAPEVVEETSKDELEFEATEEEYEQLLAYLAEPEEKEMPTLLKPLPKEIEAKMVVVDAIFEVPSGDVSLYEIPGAHRIKKINLLAGDKGRAYLKVADAGEEWYYIKLKNKRGWIKKEAPLLLYDLTPEKVALTPAPQLEEAKEEEEYTFFEGSVDGAPVFSEPSESARKTGSLKVGISYLAVKSKKVGLDRWFELQISDTKTGWVRGIDLFLATPELEEEEEDLEDLEDVSFGSEMGLAAPDWVVGKSKNTRVYLRPSIGGKVILNIAPPESYQVFEASLRGGQEWYMIKLKDENGGWVRALDVQPGKPGAWR